MEIRGVSEDGSPVGGWVKCGVSTLRSAWMGISVLSGVASVEFKPMSHLELSILSRRVVKLRQLIEKAANRGDQSAYEGFVIEFGVVSHAINSGGNHAQIQ